MSWHTEQKTTVMYRTKENSCDEWGLWKELPVGGTPLIFSNYYRPMYFEFKTMEELVTSKYPLNLPPDGLTRGALRNLEERVSKLEKLRYVVVAETKASS